MARASPSRARRRRGIFNHARRASHASARPRTPRTVVWTRRVNPTCGRLRARCTDRTTMAIWIRLAQRTSGSPRHRRRRRTRAPRSRLRRARGKTTSSSGRSTGAKSTSRSHICTSPATSLQPARAQAAPGAAEGALAAGVARSHDRGGPGALGGDGADGALRGGESRIDSSLDGARPRRGGDARHREPPQLRLARAAPA